MVEKENIKTLPDLVSFIKNLIKEFFTGSIEIHFSQGGIANIDLHVKIK